MKLFKKAISVFLTGALIFGGFSGMSIGCMEAYAQTDLPSANALGTEESPYIINEPDDLVWLSDHVETEGGKYYVQTANIDMSGVSINPIGYADETTYNPWCPFYGTYDGQWYTISHLSIDSNWKYVGLFGYVGTEYADDDTEWANSLGTGNIKNIILDNITVNASTEGANVGGLVGYIIPYEGTASITNCHVTGVSTVTGAKDTYAGGVVGNSCGGSVIGCSNNANVSASPATTSASYSIGGVVGFMQGQITNCSNTGDVYGGEAFSDTNNSTFFGVIGGVVGYLSGNMSYCYSSGDVTYSGIGDNIEGGVVGNYHSGGGTISNTFFLDTSADYGINYNGVQPPSFSGAISKTVSEFKDNVTFIGWGFSNVWRILTNEVPTHRMPPIDIITNKTGTQLEVSWSAVTGATGYKVYLGTSRGVYSTPSATTTETSATITGLDSETTYYLVVTATDADGESPYSYVTVLVPPAVSADVEITAFDAISNVDAGTAGIAAYADATAVIAVLPTTVTANTNAVTVPVDTWVDTDTYNPVVAGSYTFTATMGAIPTGYANAGGHTATVEVVVAAPTYGVTYNDNGSTGGTVPTDGSSYHTTDTATVLGNTGSLVRTGYTFAGWNTLANGSGTSYTGGNTFAIVSSNVTLHAQWTAVEYTVTYDGNNNTGGAVPVDGNTYNITGNATVLGNTGSLVRTGYTFAGWNTLANGSGTGYAPSATLTMGAGNVTLYAKWTPDSTYSVTYNANGSTGGTIPTDGTNYHTTDTVTVLGNTGTLVKANHSFAGWNTAANGSGNSYSGGNTFAIATSNVTLYAQWTPDLTYSVTYDANGSTGGTIPTDGTTYYNGTTVTVLGNIGSLVRTGYTFAGWNTLANGSGTDYAPSATFAIGSSDVTLYAKWNVAFSSDATLKASSTVKGQSVTSLGTPNATLGSETSGAVTITAAKAADTSNTGSFSTLFDKNDINATVKAVKYASGTTDFSVFDGTMAYTNGIITDGDFFIVRVTAEDGTTINYYRISVAVTPAPSIAKAITAFNFNGLTPAVTGTVDEGAKTITLTVPNGTDVTALVPTITHTGTSISPNTGVAQNFTTPVAYTVTFTDSSTQDYTATVSVGASSNSNLSALSISWGTLSPVFASGTTSYTASVGNAYSSTTVTPTVADGNATVKVNGLAVTSGGATGEINLSVGNNIITVVVTAQDGTTISTYMITVTRAASSGGSGGSGGGSSSTTTTQSSQSTIQNTVVVVNGKEQNAGKETQTTEGGKSTVTVAVDKKAVESKIDEAIKTNTTGLGNVIQVPVADTKSEVAKVELTGDIVKKLEENAFDVSVKRDNVEYIIPAEEFTISNVAENLGLKEKDLSEIKVEVKITKLDEKVVEKYNEVAKANGAELVFPPVQFEITAKTTNTDGTTKEHSINKFSNYVERVMEIPAGVDPSKITTGIVFNEDGTYSHVPTEVYQKDGKWYAKLNSLTNSDYSVIWNPVTVRSVENHWAKDAVNDMASRLVIFNTEDFEPDEAITRADFAEYIVRGLGLYREGSTHENNFRDVSSKGERTLAILIANEYGIVSGYSDGTFRGGNQITREEAMAMYQRAMKITKLVGSDDNRCESYTDYSQVSDWAKTNVKNVLSAHVFNGTTATTISPKASLTYAEAAQAVKNLLVESKLISQ